MQSCIVVYHQFKPQVVTAFFKQGCADQSPTMLRHKIDHFRSYIVSSSNKVAFIFSVFIIDYNYKFAGFNVFDRTIYRIKHITNLYKGKNKLLRIKVARATLRNEAALNILECLINDYFPITKC